MEQPNTSMAKQLSEPLSPLLKMKNNKRNVPPEGYVSLQGLVTYMFLRTIDGQGPPYLLRKLKLDDVEVEVALWREAAKADVAEGMSVKISHLKGELKPRYGLTFNSTTFTNVEVLSATGKRGRKKKDPNEPKRPACAFILFSSERRPIVKEQHPDLSFGGCAKKLGEMWSTLPQSDKQPYEEQAQKRKEKYDMDMVAYRKISQGPGSSVQGGGR